MGADGHIKIWKRKEIEKAFPDCEELFKYLPQHYIHELDGIKYDHCYHGDNIYDVWYNIKDCYIESIKNSPEKIQRLKDFIVWLQTHGTHWEVWT